MNKKIRLCAAAQNLGQEAAAAASTCGASRVVAVTLGDFNLTETEVQDHTLSRSLVKHAFCMAASQGVMDSQGRLHQDLVLVDADRVPDVTWTPIRSDVRGFDGVHQAVQARICSQGPAAAASAGQVAASAAASTRRIPPQPPQYQHEVPGWPGYPTRPPGMPVFFSGPAALPSPSGTTPAPGRRPHGSRRAGGCRGRRRRSLDAPLSSAAAGSEASCAAGGSRGAAVAPSAAAGSEGPGHGQQGRGQEGQGLVTCGTLASDGQLARGHVSSGTGRRRPTGSGFCISRTATGSGCHCPWNPRAGAVGRSPASPSLSSKTTPTTSSAGRRGSTC